MAIDVYMFWKGQDPNSNYSAEVGTRGKVGYLREAYHGAPYATRALVPEGFGGNTGYEGNELVTVPIKSSTMRDRLPAAVLVALYRYHIVYGEAFEPVGAITVDGGSEEEAIASSVAKAVEGIKTAKSDTEEIVRQITPAQVESAQALIETGQLPDYALDLVDFVELAERMEKLTGESCDVMVDD